MNLFSCNDTRSYFFDRFSFISNNSTLAVDRLSEGVYNSSEKFIADRNRNDFICSFYRISLFNFSVGAEHNCTYKITLKVKRHSVNSAFKFKKFAGHTFFQSVDSCDTVADSYNCTHVFKLQLCTVMLNLFFNYTSYFIRA